MYQYLTHILYARRVFRTPPVGSFKNAREIFPVSFFCRIHNFLRTELFILTKHNEL